MRPKDGSVIRVAQATLQTQTKKSSSTFRRCLTNLTDPKLGGLLIVSDPAKPGPGTATSYSVDEARLQIFADAYWTARNGLKAGTDRALLKAKLTSQPPTPANMICAIEAWQAAARVERQHDVVKSLKEHRGQLEQHFRAWPIATTGQLSFQMSDGRKMAVTTLPASLICDLLSWNRRTRIQIERLIRDATIMEVGRKLIICGASEEKACAIRKLVEVKLDALCHAGIRWSDFEITHDRPAKAFEDARYSYRKRTGKQNCGVLLEGSRDAGPRSVQPASNHSPPKKVHDKDARFTIAKHRPEGGLVMTTVTQEEHDEHVRYVSKARTDWFEDLDQTYSLDLIGYGVLLSELESNRYFIENADLYPFMTRRVVANRMKQNRRIEGAIAFQKRKAQAERLPSQTPAFAISQDLQQLQDKIDALAKGSPYWPALMDARVAAAYCGFSGKHAARRFTTAVNGGRYCPPVKRPGEPLKWAKEQLDAAISREAEANLVGADGEWDVA